jgi:uncharacterized membrane-anchored protein
MLRKMIKSKLTLWLCLAGWLSTEVLVHAQDTTTNAIPPEIVQILKNLKYQQGEIELQGGLAKLTVPKEFSYLGPDDAATVLTELWGNPPTKTKPLGMLLPAGLTPISSNIWAVTINYSEGGFVKDGDASTINYDDLLKQMQKTIAEQNPARREHHYPTFNLIGWAAPPRYDSQTHKLYWAKDLKFDGQDVDTLNYNIRILGRKGVLELNAIADINQFADIDQQTPQILSMVDFKEGNRYADFDPKTDKVAEYGIATLVAGGALAVAAKVGLLKALWLGIIAFWKFIIIGVAAIGAFLKKLFSRKDSSTGGSPGV